MVPDQAVVDVEKTKDIGLSEVNRGLALVILRSMTLEELSDLEDRISLGFLNEDPSLFPA